MQQEIIISGFGGQGTLFAGQVLAYAAMDSGLQVTWIPSYGPEMRGGRARCTVIVSEDEIGAPLVRRPSAAIVLNIPSLEYLAPSIKQDGVLVANASLVPMKSDRGDIRAYHIPATAMAIELGDVRVANSICLGLLICCRSTTRRCARGRPWHTPSPAPERCPTASLPTGSGRRLAVQRDRARADLSRSNADRLGLLLDLPDHRVY